MRRRGFTTLLVLAVLAGLAMVIVIGLDRRTGDLDFEGRTLCRLASRTAADSAMARAQALLERGAQIGGELRGELPAQRKAIVRYSLRAKPDANGTTIIAEGSCELRDATAIVTRIETHFSRGRRGWAADDWREAPAK